MDEKAAAQPTPLDVVNQSLALRNLVHKRYEDQLRLARLLARYKVKKRIAAGLLAAEPDSSSERRKRVREAASELYDILVFVGSDNPYAEDIRTEVSKAMNMELHFTYPPGEGLRIMAQDGDQKRPLTDEELQACRKMLWKITRQKIDGSMFRQPSRLDGHY